MKISIKSLFFILAIPATLFGQGYDTGQVYDTLSYELRAEISQQAINDLKNGVLVVRLKTGNNKLRALQRVALSPDISPKEKEKFESKIAKHQEEIQEENDNLIESLRAHYTFSPILYLADTSIHLLKDGQQSGFFLNEKMETDPSLSLNERPYLVTYYGSTISPTKNGEEGLVILDQDLQELVEPFPYFTGLSTTRKLLLRFWDKQSEIEQFYLMAERFNKKLKEFSASIE